MSFYKHGEGNLIFVTGGAVKDFPAFLQKQCEKDKSSQRFWFAGRYRDY